MPAPCRALLGGRAATAAATPSPAPQTARLSNGLLVRCVSKRDVAFLDQEIYQRHGSGGCVYLRHGIQLPPGGVVLDVGANIGLFSLRAAQELGPGGLVISCEPMPATFDCLAHNVAAHRSWWRRQRQGPAARGDAGAAPILALNVGVGSGQQPSATFTFYPRAAGWSSMRPAEGDVEADMGAFLDQALSSRGASTAAGLDPTTAALGRWLRSAAPRWAYAAAWRLAVARMLSGAQRLACPLVSVSQLIRQHRLAAVDLLKVDVERAELEVLRGVEGCHWPLVRQAALEVHAADLEEVVALLRRQARFSSVVVEQEAALAGTSLHAVYCRR